MCVSNDGLTLFSGSADNDIRVWDATEETERLRVEKANKKVADDEAHKVELILKRSLLQKRL